MRIIKINAGAEALRHFFPLFQEGIVVEAETAGSVKAFLCEQIGLDPYYVEESISTVFLDGMPVDDMDAAVLHDGAALALSAAMPGLVGATFRKGGYYAPLRSAISYRSAEAPDGAGRGRVRIKLFNTVMEAAGAQFLRRGIVLSASRTAQVLGMLAQEMPGGLDGLTEDIPQPAGDVPAEGSEELLLVVDLDDAKG